MLLPAWSRLVVAVLVGVFAAVMPVTAASAHQVGGMGATNFHVTLTAIEPAVAGVSLRVIENGGRLELRNETEAVVVIAGYSGEPYARVGPDGVQVNDSSPATVLNAGRFLTTALPATDGQEAPVWRQVSRDPVWRWHDHRVHWSLTTLPPGVAAAPDEPHRIRDWTVPLWYGEAMTPMAAAGTLDWVPGPAPRPWFTQAALLAVGVVALALLRAPHRLLAGAVGLFAAAYLLHGLGVMVAVAGSVPQQLSVLFGAESFLVWPIAAVTAVLLWRRRTWAGWLAAGLGLVVAFQVYRGDAAAWWSSSAPSALPSTVNRLAIALVIGLGAGLVLALPVLRRRHGASGQAGAAARSGPGAGRPSSVVGSRLQAAAMRSTSASATSTSDSSPTSAGSPT